ncbi:MAG: hypothetical protein EZS28_025194 [Streblomastix strix]|uniref:RNase H type-1 domain-containing protein n=1 Tax=Streblomastix strix TaxID=222440 RepID=A0A5J4V9P5_9EUKA|nr:MAG: hypothetical protein EZS28_025194 [Streblomastix strix]
MQHSKQWGKSINIEQCRLNTAFPNLLRTCTSIGSNKDTERVRHKITELRQRFALPALVRRKIARINFDNNENFRSFWMNYSPRKMQNRTKTVDQLSRLDMGLGKDVYKDDISKKTGITILIKGIYQPIRESSPDQDQVSNINNRQTEFSNSPSKRYFPLIKINRLSKNESFEGKRMEREYDSNQRNPSRAISVQGVIMRNQDMTLKVRIPEAVMVSDASPKGWGVTLELQTGDTLVQHGEWNREQKKWTSNKKETEAIYLGLLLYGQVFKELQIKAILIKSDSSTAVQDLAKQRAVQTLVAEVKKIVKLCQQLRIQTQTQHIPGISKKITDALSRLCTQGDYSVKKEIFIALCQAWQIVPTLDLFATGENKLVDRFVTIGEVEEGAEWLNAFSRLWNEEIFWIYPPIPKI